MKKCTSRCEFKVELRDVTIKQELRSGGDEKDATEGSEGKGGGGFHARVILTFAHVSRRDFCEKCGNRLLWGTLRTSITPSHPARVSSAKNEGNVWLECPTVKI